MLFLWMINFISTWGKIKDEYFILQIDDMLRKYHERLFADIDNVEDIGSFTAFLLVHEKITWQESFHHTVTTVRRDLTSVIEEMDVS